MSEDNVISIDRCSHANCPFGMEGKIADILARLNAGDSRSNSAEQRVHGAAEDMKELVSAKALINAARLDAVEAWEAKQNGSLGRIEGKVDGLVLRVDDRITGLQYWAMGTLASALVAAVGWLVVLLRAKL